MLEQLLKNCSPCEGPTLEQFMKDCIPWEGPHAGAGEEWEEETEAEMKRYGLTVIPIPHPPALVQGVEEVGQLGVNLSLRRRR